MPPADHTTTQHPGPRQLVLLGAGHAHRQVLQHLSLHPLPGLQVTLIAPHPRQVYPAMVPGFVAGHYALDDCLIHLDGLVHRSGVRWRPLENIGPVLRRWATAAPCAWPSLAAVRQVLSWPWPCATACLTRH